MTGPRSQWTTLRNLVELLVRLGADEPAVVIAVASEVAETAAPTFGSESERRRRSLAAARERLGPEAFEAARRRGRQMSAHDAAEFALAVTNELGERSDQRPRPG